MDETYASSKLSPSFAAYSFSGDASAMPKIPLMVAVSSADNSISGRKVMTIAAPNPQAMEMSTQNAK